MRKKSYYRLDQARKLIVIDDSVTPTPTEKELINAYVSAGWIVRVKSQARAEATKKRMKKEPQLTGQEIEQALRGTEKLETYKAILRNKGFFSARKWFKDQGVELSIDKVDQAVELNLAPEKKRRGRPPKKQADPVPDLGADADGDQIKEEGKL